MSKHYRCFSPCAFCASKNELYRIELMDIDNQAVKAILEIKYGGKENEFYLCIDCIYKYTIYKPILYNKI